MRQRLGRYRFLIATVTFSVLSLSGCFEPDPPPHLSMAGDCRCDSTVHDPLEEPIRFSSGRFDGRCIDSCRYRRARLIDRNMALKLHLKPPDAKHILVGNLLHDNQYWIARVPLDQVQNVNVLFEHFWVGISHTLLRFHFKGQGIPLYPQNAKQNKDPGFVHDILISAEGVPAKGEHYEVLDSALGTYTIAYRIYSAEWKWHALKKSGFVVNQYRLDLAPENAAKLLRQGLKASETKSFASTYQLLFNNCATALIDLVEPFAPARSAHDLLHFDRGFPTDIGNGTIRSLRDLGLIPNEESAHLIDFSSEEPIQSAH